MEQTQAVGFDIETAGAGEAAPADTKGRSSA